MNKKSGVISFAILVCLLFLPVYVNASPEGCCTYPDVSIEAFLCSEVSLDRCCGDAEDEEYCENEHFYEGESCYDEAGMPNYDECLEGCCCIEDNEGRVYVDPSLPEAACPSDIFDAGITDPDECRNEFCGVDEIYEPPRDFDEKQCMFYYCDGTQVPEGPEPVMPSDLLDIRSVFPGVGGQITAAMTTPVTTSDGIEHYVWLVNEEGAVFLYDENRNLVQDNLDFFNMDENPTRVVDLLEGHQSPPYEASYFHSLTSVAKEGEDDEAGKIFFTEDEYIYEYELETSMISSTYDFPQEPSSFDFMTSFGSYKFIDYLLLVGYEDVDDRLRFYNPSLEEPFTDFYSVANVSPMIGRVDTIKEITFEDDYYPCVMLIGGCSLWGDCEDDNECFHPDECSYAECENGACITYEKDDMIECADGEGFCCGGECQTEGINYEYNESCRTGPYCEDGFLEYQADNEGNDCAGECYTCQGGFCEPSDDACGAEDVTGIENDEEVCCDEGECVPCEDAGDNCEEGEIDCFDDDKTYKECESITVNGEEIWRWPSETEECDSDLCYEATCEDGTGDDAGCGQEPIEEDEEDPDGCQGEEGCTEAQNCRCDGNGQCSSICLEPQDCSVENPECQEPICEDGNCGFENIEGICTVDGETGLCDDGECIIHGCHDCSDCESQVCYDVSCVDGSCDYTPSEDGTIDTIEHEGENMFVECDGDGGYDEELEDCPDEECVTVDKTSAEDGFYCTFQEQHMVECQLANTDTGVCDHGSCVECTNEAQCGVKKVCVDNECLEDCTEEGAEAPPGKVCDEDTGQWVECLDHEHCDDDVENRCDLDEDECVECLDNTDCEHGQACHYNNECDDDCRGAVEPIQGKVCDEDTGQWVECLGSDDCDEEESICDLDENECVECIDDGDCVPGEFCEENKCVEFCEPKADIAEGIYCDEDTGEWVDCLDDEHCDDGVCIGGECFECKNNNHCDDEEVCVNEECFEDCREKDSEEAPDVKPYCDEETGLWVECLDTQHCHEGQVCHNNECVDECDDEGDCSGNDVCVDNACVDCENKHDCLGDDVCVENSCVDCRDDNDCEGENDYCNKEENECVECNADEHCDGGEHCYENVCHGGCIEDEHCPGDDVCDEETGKCFRTCDDDGDCPQDEFCDIGEQVCVDCTQNTHCDDGNECTLNNCTEENVCETSYEETQGDECDLNGDDGFCHQGGCVEVCTDDQNHEDCHGDKGYCYIPEGQEEGFCVDCYEEDHCEPDECMSVEGCCDWEFECEYSPETGTDCTDCDSQAGHCVCYEGNCIEECHEEHNPCEEDGEFCGDDGFCVECEDAEDCDDGNDCTLNECENGFCTTETKEDVETRCGEDNEGYCCEGECLTDVEGDDFHSDCSEGDVNCQAGRLKINYTNQGDVCGDTECTVCNYGYCDYNNENECGDGETCVEGECIEGCEEKCEEGESECRQGARIADCTEHSNIDECYVWDKPEKCPDETCMISSCYNGECDLAPVVAGETDEGCWADTGCEGDICRCDGLGNCEALECETSDDCDDEQRPCQVASCVDNECEFEDREDGSNCPGGTCCGGVCNTDTDNKYYNESCRSEEPQCVGGSYQYLAENDGEICAGECAVCDDGSCEDNHTKCPEGQECSDGECVGCQNKCSEGETRCSGDYIQTCEEVNGCMTWGSREECDDDGLCTEGVCERGECIVQDVGEGETTEECFGRHGCGSNDCYCDGEGNCVAGEEDEQDPYVIDDDEEEIEPDPTPEDDEEERPQEELGLGWLLWLVLVLVVIGGLTGAYYYDVGGLNSKVSDLFSNKKRRDSQNYPKMQGTHLSPSTSGRTQAPSQSGASPKSKTADPNLEKELYNYLQTLKRVGPNRDKELELLRKGASQQKIKELHELARKEKEKMAQRKEKFSKFEK